MDRPVDQEFGKKREALRFMVEAAQNFQRICLGLIPRASCPVRQNQGNLYFFSELGTGRQRLAGGKAGTLARLYQQGYPVPNGLIVMPAAFQEGELPPAVWAQVRSCLGQQRRAGAVSFAVRSSALGEDSAAASFAGQFATVLNVRTDDEVWEALQTVRRSRRAAGARAYSEAMGIAMPRDMAVIIQQMAPAEISGVLFTADPVTGNHHQLTGNCIFGLGDRLVSGQAAPLSFTLERPSGRRRRVGYKGPSALRRFAGRLYMLGARLERELGGPQDIEWAVGGGKLFLLQSRPVTASAGRHPAPGDWNDSLAGDCLWSNINFGEAMPQVMAPFSWSVTQGIFESCSTLLPGLNNSGNIGGRPYLNLSIAAAILQAFGANGQHIRRVLEGMYTRLPDGLEIPTLPLPRWSCVLILINLLKLMFKYHRAFRQLPRYLAVNPARCGRMQERIREIGSKSGLCSLWRDEIEPHLLRGAWIYVATASRLRYTDKVRRQLAGLAGTDDADRLLSSLGSGTDINGSGVSEGSDLLASLGPVLGLARVARGEMDRTAYMARYGHRGPNEFELSVPRPAEDPGWFEEQLTQFARSPVDVDALLAQQQAVFSAAWERFRASHPRRAPSMRRRIAETALRNRQREAGRSEYTRDRWLARSFALRAGQLTGLGDDIFFLTVDEVQDLLSGDETAARQIPARKDAFSRYAALPTYPPLIRGRFDPFRWAADPRRQHDIYDASAPDSISVPCASDEQGRVITGTAVSAGRVEGVVRRLDRPEQGDQLQRGEILVTPLTDIAWTPLFPRAAAIVTDVGAPLSHTAIMARELGIPAVVGCSNATVQLHTGDRVRVDGGRGTVTLLNRAEPA